MKKYFFLSLALLIFVSCTKDRELITEPESNSFKSPLFINELVVKGSTNNNEFGSPEDWIEIYNSADTAFTLQNGQWFITDDASSDPLHYALPNITIPANGYYVIWCDGLDTIANDVHTNFKLGADGENVGLFYLNATKKADSYNYPAQNQDGVSYARIPDGSSNWGELNNPTLGASN